MVLKQFLALMIVATIMALVVNFVSPNGIALVGNYRTLSSGEGPIVPPSAEAGDPPFIDINQAQMEHSLGAALFVDAREPEEFECGTIPGSVNIPFEYLPEGDLTAYLDSAFGQVPTDHTLIVFCSGDECDLSLHLGRNLNTFGYSEVLIFFGGAREWEASGLEVERRVECGS